MEKHLSVTLNNGDRKKWSNNRSIREKTEKMTGYRVYVKSSFKFLSLGDYKTAPFERQCTLILFCLLCFIGGRFKSVLHRVF